MAKPQRTPRSSMPALRKVAPLERVIEPHPEPPPDPTHESVTFVIKSHNYDWPGIIKALGFLTLCVAAAVHSFL